MALIYSSFTQNIDQPLPDLIGEYTNMMDFFNSKEIKKQVDFKAAYDKSVSELTSELLQQHNLNLFHFSGHSGSEGLDFQNENFDKEHFVQFFNALNTGSNKLDCVLLNGCSNVELVKRLSNVPVVIGTTSPILNKDAIKFTSDFFGALIGGKVSYEAAFRKACSAVTNVEGEWEIIRGGGAVAQRNQEQGFNQYFMAVNDEKVAARAFPLKQWYQRGLLPWLVALVFFVAMGVGGYFYVNKEEIIPIKKECPKWNDKDKCNILVEDFSNTGVHKKINDGIESNLTLREYIEANYSDDIEKEFIRDNRAITENELPEECKYEYNMTGHYNSSKVLTVRLVPNSAGVIPKIRKYIEHLDDLEGFFEDYKVKNTDEKDILVGQICVACFIKRQIPVEVAVKEIDKLKNNEEDKKVFSKFFEQIAQIALYYKDTTGALLALQKGAEINEDDKTLAFVEEKGDLELGSRKYMMAYGSWSDYMDLIEQRLNNPEQFEKKETNQKYKKASLAMRLKRANVVLNYPKQMLSLNGDAKFRQLNIQTLKDFKLLDAKRFNGKSYLRQIEIIQKRLELPPPPKDPVIVKSLTAITEGQGRIKDAYVDYKNDRYNANNQGEITIPCLEDDCIGETITVHAKGYTPKTVKLTSTSESQNVQLQTGAPPPPVKMVQLSVRNGANTRIITAYTYYGGKKYNANRKGNISFACPSNNCIGKTIKVLAPNHQATKIKLTQLNENINVLLKALPAKVVQLKIETTKGKPITAALASYSNVKYTTDSKGLISISCPSDKCIGKSVVVKAKGYENANIKLMTTSKVIPVQLKAIEPLRFVNLSIKNVKESAIKDAVTTYAGKRYTSNSNGSIDIPCPSNNCLGKSVVIEAKGYQTGAAKLTSTTQVIPVQLKAIVQTRFVTLIIRGNKRNVLKNAVTTYAGKRYTSNGNGIISIPCPSNNCIGQSVKVVAKGYQTASVKLTTTTKEIPVQLRTMIIQMAKRTIKGKVIGLDKKSIAGVTVILGNKRVETNSRGEFNMGSYTIGQLPAAFEKGIQFSRTGYGSIVLSQAEFQKNTTIQLRYLLH